ncbi:hypothetical protein CEXT_501121 [Caerostris extrusa]|uniref:Uncharacterized protein n=1 Tax=Caerostris extrusa TaxID=172846 RepID=A0AAV4NFR0_CAEEX|nr:hypothetical protein CEXT_501121 [Caerostris extrusa]
MIAERGFKLQYREGRESKLISPLKLILHCMDFQITDYGQCRRLPLSSNNAVLVVSFAIDGDVINKAAMLYVVMSILHSEWRCPLKEDFPCQQWSLTRSMFVRYISLLLTMIAERGFRLQCREGRETKLISPLKLILHRMDFQITVYEKCRRLPLSSNNAVLVCPLQLMET